MSTDFILGPGTPWLMKLLLEKPGQPPLVQYLGRSGLSDGSMVVREWQDKRRWCFCRNRKEKSKPWVTDFKLGAIRGCLAWRCPEACCYSRAFLTPSSFIPLIVNSRPEVASRSEDANYSSLAVLSVAVVSGGSTLWRRGFSSSSSNSDVSIWSPVQPVAMVKRRPPEGNRIKPAKFSNWKDEGRKDWKGLNVFDASAQQF